MTNGNLEVSTNPPPIGENESSESLPYMILPDTDSSEMKLVIEEDENNRIITPNEADAVVNMNTIPQSQCCLLI